MRFPFGNRVSGSNAARVALSFSANTGRDFTNATSSSYSAGESSGSTSTPFSTPSLPLIPNKSRFSEPTGWIGATKSLPIAGPARDSITDTPNPVRATSTDGTQHRISSNIGDTTVGPPPLLTPGVDSLVPLPAPALPPLLTMSPVIANAMSSGALVFSSTTARSNDVLYALGDTAPVHTNGFKSLKRCCT